MDELVKTLPRHGKRIGTWFNGLHVALRFFLATVILPTVIAAIYYGLIISDVYIAEAKYALRANSNTASTTLFDSILSSSSGYVPPNEDASIVREFIISRDMVIKLDNILSIRNRFASTDIDVFSRFNIDASMEDFLKYYRGKIEVGIDAYTNIITLRVHAFDPVVAHDIAKTIIELSEELVNTISTRVVEDTLQFARSEVEDAEIRVRAASDALTQFRSDTNSINPAEETKAVLGIITELETLLAAARTQLIEAQSFMQSSSPQVQVLKGKVKALEKQVLDERTRLSSQEGAGTGYTRLIDDYQPLILEQDLATKRYASALASLELARIEAQRKQRYIVPFVQPQIPDKALEPNRTKSIITVFLGLCIVYAIGGLIWAAIKDHMRI